MSCFYYIEHSRRKEYVKYLLKFKNVKEILKKLMYNKILYIRGYNMISPSKKDILKFLKMREKTVSHIINKQDIDIKTLRIIYRKNIKLIRLYLASEFYKDNNEVIYDNL